MLEVLDNSEQIPIQPRYNFLLYRRRKAAVKRFRHSGRYAGHRIDVKTLFIEPGSPWENGYIESFNGKLRDELLDREIFDTLLEAKVLIERWREEYNTVRPHSSLGYRAPALETILPSTTCSATLHKQLKANSKHVS
jgi:transposase InsO family protein